MKKLILVFVLLVVLVVGMLGYMFYKQRQTAVTSREDTTLVGGQGAPVTQDTVSWEGISTLGLPLIPLNESEVYGGVEIAVAAEETQITVTVTGETNTGKNYVANVRTGICPNPGEVKYALTAVTNGSSVTSLDEPISTISQELPLTVTVQESADGAVLACGDFIAQ